MSVRYVVQTAGICFGRPRINGTGTRTDTIYDLWLAGESVRAIALWFNHITEPQVRAAIRYERKRLRKPEKRKKRRCFA